MRWAVLRERPSSREIDGVGSAGLGREAGRPRNLPGLAQGSTGGGSMALEVVVTWEGYDPQGNREPPLSSGSIWGPLENPEGPGSLASWRAGPQNTRFSRCLLCWFALFIYLL